MTTAVDVAEEAVSAAEANRQFSRILRGVRDGRTYVVTSHGRPVARILPPDVHDGADEGKRTVLLARLAAQSVTEVGRWTRDELYEDDGP